MTHPQWNAFDRARRVVSAAAPPYVANSTNYFISTKADSLDLDGTSPRGHFGSSMSGLGIRFEDTRPPLLSEVSHGYSSTVPLLPQEAPSSAEEGRNFSYYASYTSGQQGSISSSSSGTSLDKTGKDELVFALKDLICDSLLSSSSSAELPSLSTASGSMSSISVISPQRSIPGGPIVDINMNQTFRQHLFSQGSAGVCPDDMLRNGPVLAVSPSHGSGLGSQLRPLVEIHCPDSPKLYYPSPPETGSLMVPAASHCQDPTATSTNETGIPSIFPILFTPVLDAHYGVPLEALQEKAARYRQRHPGMDYDSSWLLSFAGKLSCLGQRIDHYRCYVQGCTQTNRRKDHIAVHIGTHLGYKPIKCEFCEMRFTRPNESRRHTMSTHTCTRFSCETCDKSFRRRDALARHMKRYHRKRTDHEDDDYASGESDKENLRRVKKRRRLHQKKVKVTEVPVLLETTNLPL